MLTSRGRFPIQFHLNAGQQHAPLYGVPRAPAAPLPPPPPPPPLPFPCRLSNCNLAAEEGAYVCVCFVWAGMCVCVVWGWVGGGGHWPRLTADWIHTCYDIHCFPSLCAQWAAERITVKWDDINYPNPDSSLWSCASTHQSQERTWMVRQRECQRSGMKAREFSRGYSQQKNKLLAE